MTYSVKFTKLSTKKFSKLSKEKQRLIQRYINNTILTADSPFDFGKHLKGNLKDLWRYRIEYFRLICKIQDNILIVLILDIDHHNKIYR